MADPSILLHDLRAVVTEASPATTTVRPQTATETDAQVLNPAQAIDGSPTSYAELTDASGQAILTLSDFENQRLISDAGRDWCEVSIRADWGSTPPGDDSAVIEFRGISTDSWTSLDTAAGGAEWDGSTRVWAITTPAGSEREADWELRVTYNPGSGGGTFQVLDVSVEIGGTVVAPTDAELAEDVAELAAAKFASWWETLAAAVESALVTFGSSASERSAVLNGIRDETSAADAYQTLTGSAARAQAEAYEETAVAVGFPRYTADES